MKKLRYLFTGALAFLGLSTTWAETDKQYETGDQVTDIAKVAADGTPVLLMSAMTNVSWCNPGLYLSPEGFTESVASTGLYKFEATGNTVDGSPTYYLYSVSEGKYIRAEVFNTGITGATGDDTSDLPPSDAGGRYYTYTSSTSNAYEFTALNPVEGSSDVRTKVDGDVDAESFVFTEKTAQPLGNYAHFGTYGDGLFTIYEDCIQWDIFEAKELVGADKLAAYLDSNYPNGVESLYVSGSNPGNVPTDVYQALVSAYTAALDLSNASGTTEAQAEAAIAALDKAADAAEAAIITLQDGKYYFFNSFQSGNPYVYADASGLHGSSSYKVPTAETATISDAAYIWKAISTGNGQWAFLNIGTQKYAGEQATTSAKVPTSDTPVAFTLTYKSNLAAGRFNIHNSTLYYHIDGSMNMVRWNDADAAGDQFAFTVCDDAIATALESQAAQNNLNEELATAIDNATALYNKGRISTATGATADDLFDEPGLVTSVDKLSSNATEAGEGSLDNLVDGDFSTYFHSCWSGTTVGGGEAPNDYHYIQADLGQAVSNIVIKYSKRHNNQTNFNPTKVRFYGSNDGENWTYGGTFPLTYDYEATLSDTETASNFIGIRGFENSEAYRYVRIAVVETQLNTGKINGYPYFYLSELHFYGNGTYDKANSVFENIDADVASTFKSAIDAALAEQAGGKATAETIAALKAATETFEAQYPDVTLLTSAISAAKATSTGYPTGDELGYYSADEQQNLDSVIEAVEATVTDNMTRTAINEGIAKLDAAVAAFKATLILPEAGKIYVLRGMTTDANNTRAVDAPIYSTGNGTTTYLKSLATTAAEYADLDLSSNLNYLWRVTAIGNGKITLQNVGTGYYMNTQSSLNGAITNVPEPTELGIQGISVGGGFNLIVGDGLYVNFQGQGVNMVAWSSASGADNSSIKFEEMTDEYTGATAWPVTAGRKQIITLPFAVTVPGEGTAYTVLGQKETDGVFTLELKTIADGTSLQAGEPFLFVPEDGVSSITLITDANSFDEITYATEGLTAGNITGVISESTVEGTAKAILRNGAALVIGNDTAESLRAIDANTGYINYAETTETGDAQIVLSESMTTGIANAIITDSNATVDVYTVAGVRVRSNVKAAGAAGNLPAGLYIIGGQKVIVK